MKTKLTTMCPNGYEWSILLTGYDCFESDDIIVEYLNAVGCKTYFNKKRELIALCRADKFTDFMIKAEELYNENNSDNF